MGFSFQSTTGKGTVKSLFNDLFNHGDFSLVDYSVVKMTNAIVIYTESLDDGTENYHCCGVTLRFENSYYGPQVGYKTHEPNFMVPKCPKRLMPLLAKCVNPEAKEYFQESKLLWDQHKDGTKFKSDEYYIAIEPIKMANNEEWDVFYYKNRRLYDQYKRTRINGGNSACWRRNLTPLKDLLISKADAKNFALKYISFNQETREILAQVIEPNVLKEKLAMKYWLSMEDYASKYDEVINEKGYVWIHRDEYKDFALKGIYHSGMSIEQLLIERHGYIPRKPMLTDQHTQTRFRF